MSQGRAILVRPFERADVPELLGLMRELAIFEKYIDSFRVTEADLIEHGLGKEPRFGALVAQAPEALVGMAVHYLIPWTYDLKPTLVLKELYVSQKARGMGIGRALMEAVVAHAKACGAARVSWTVLDGNEPAERFYRQLGGEPDRKWHPWVMNLSELSAESRDPAA